MYIENPRGPRSFIFAQTTTLVVASWLAAVKWLFGGGSVPGYVVIGMLGILNSISIELCDLLCVVIPLLFWNFDNQCQFPRFSKPSTRFQVVQNGAEQSLQEHHLHIQKLDCQTRGFQFQMQIFLQRAYFSQNKEHISMEA